jgi:hypothetical protein
VRKVLFVVRLLILYPAVSVVVTYYLVAFGNRFLGITLLPVGVAIAFLIVWYLSILWYAKSFIKKIRNL